MPLSDIEASEDLTTPKISENRSAGHATSIAKDTVAMMQRRYDAQVKAFFAHKEILAPVLKNCVEELAACSLPEIMDSIQDVQGSQVPVHREDAAPVQPLLVGANTEDETADEGIVRY